MAEPPASYDVAVSRMERNLCAFCGQPPGVRVLPDLPPAHRGVRFEPCTTCGHSLFHSELWGVVEERSLVATDGTRAVTWRMVYPRPPVQRAPSA